MEYREVFVPRQADEEVVALITQRGAVTAVGAILTGVIPAVTMLRQLCVVRLAGLYPKGHLLSIPGFSVWQGEPVDVVLSDGTAVVDNGEWEEWIKGKEVVVVGDAHTPVEVRNAITLVASFDDGSWIGRFVVSPQVVTEGMDATD